MKLRKRISGHTKVLQKTTHFFAIAVLLFSTVSASILLTVQDVSAGTVNPSNPGDWVAIAGSPEYIFGPSGATPYGSLKLSTVSQEKQTYVHPSGAVALSSKPELSYRLHVDSGVPASYQLLVTGANGASFTALVWEPVYNGHPNGPNGGFTDHTNLQNGTWWSSQPIAGAPDRDTFVSLDTIISQNPGAVIQAFGVSVGSGTPNATSYIDTISFNGDSYDFEPTVLTPPVAAAQQEVRVAQSEFGNDYNKWTYHDDTANPLVAANPNATNEHEIIANPTATPLNNGAVKLAAGNSKKWNLASLQYSGTKLKDIAALGYSVYTNQPAKSYINLDVDFNHTSLHGYQGRLVYTPVGVTENTWSDQDAVASNGLWQWSNMVTGAATAWPDGDTTAKRTWNSIISAFPDATITAVDDAAFGSLYLRADGESETYYDNVYLATGAKNNRYNFEIEKDVVAPEGLQLSVSGQPLPCDGTAKVNLATASWGAVNNAASYDYEVTYGGTTVYRASLSNPSNTGAFGGGQNGDWAFRARTVYASGAKSEWSQYCNVVLDTENPVATISNMAISSDQTILSFDISAIDRGTGLKHVAVNIYNQDNTGEPLIKLGSDATGGTAGITRLNDPWSGLAPKTRTFARTISDINVSGLTPGTYVIRAFARDHLDKEHRFELQTFTITEPQTQTGGGNQGNSGTVNNGDSTGPSDGSQADNVATQSFVSAATSTPTPFTTFGSTISGDGIISAVPQPAGDGNEISNFSEDGSVLGATDNLAANAASQADDTFSGLNWPLIIATLVGAAGLWWFIAAKRRKKNEQI